MALPKDSAKDIAHALEAGRTITQADQLQGTEILVSLSWKKFNCKEPKF